MNHNPVKSAIRQFGLPRIIIVGFFIFLVIAAGGFQMNLMQLLSDCVRRWGMFLSLIHIYCHYFHHPSPGRGHGSGRWDDHSPGW